MSMLSDRARDFWERISPRERNLVVVLAIATPVILALWLGLEIHDGLDAMATRNDKTRHALAVLDDLRARGSAAPPVPVDDWMKGLPAEPLSLDTYVNKAAQKAGFQLKGTRPHSNIPRNGVIVASISFDTEPLPIDELKTFLQALESDSKYVAVTKMSIRRNHSKPDEIEATLDVATYAAEKKADDAGSGGGAGSSGSSGKGG